MLVIRLFVFLAIATTSLGDLPTNGLIFFETFQEDVFESGKWQKSSVSDYDAQPVKITSSGIPGVGFENDTALELTEAMKAYAVGIKFPSPIDILEKDLIIQYEVKFEDSLSCGGAYVKLLRQSDDLDIAKLNNKTPYSVMFGPDKCGSNDKVHFIIDHKNPISMIWEEKHFTDAPPIKSDKKSHLYTLHMKKDNSFEIFIDTKSIKKGNLLKDMEPPFNPPAEIDDPNDKKPNDWVDEAKISDPTASKPNDWDENEPQMVDDPKDKKPHDWLDDGPFEIPDPTVSKPDDCDDIEVNKFTYIHDIFISNILNFNSIIFNILILVLIYNT